jgi:hypothetical protein
LFSSPDCSPEPPAGLSADELALVRFMDAWAIDHQNVDPAIHDELVRARRAAEALAVGLLLAICRP